jgi:hypothetical protein
MGTGYVTVSVHTTLESPVQCSRIRQILPTGLSTSCSVLSTSRSHMQGASKSSVHTRHGMNSKKCLKQMPALNSAGGGAVSQALFLQSFATCMHPDKVSRSQFALSRPGWKARGWTFIET